MPSHTGFENTMQSIFNQLRARVAALFPQFGRTERELIVVAWQHLYAHRQWIGVTAVVVAVIALAILPYEMEWLATVQQDKSRQLAVIAKRLSHWGDFFPGSLIIAAALWLCGRLFNRQMLIRAGIACLLAAALAGIFADVFRFGLGRARPNSGFPDGFYGPSFSSKLHGFPSGHTTSALATGVALAVALPPIAIPVVALGASVGWSRLYLNYHRPTDVLVGATIGSIFGLAFGFAARARPASTQHQS